MRVAICDDDAKDLRHLSNLLMQYDPSIHVACFESAQALYESTRETEFDAVLLDIEMESPNGYEIALRLSREESHPIIMFVTNSAAYAVQGYGLALRYLLKPLTTEALRDAMDALRQELSNNRVIVTLNGTSHVLKVQDILYAEVVNHHITLHTTKGTCSYRTTLRELMAQMPKRWFCAPHQSYVVNLLHICTASAQEVCMMDGTRIPITRGRQREFLQSFHHFLGV